MTDTTPGRSGLQCPDCGKQAAPGQELCGCGYPLLLHEEDPQPQPAVTRAPGEQDPSPRADDDTPVVPLPAVPPPRLQADEAPCPACGQANGSERTWCSRCGEPLRAPEPVTQALPPLPPPRRSGWQRAAVVAAGLLVVAAVAGLVLGVLLSDDDGPSSRTTASPQPSAPAVAPVPVPASQITATASNTREEPDPGRPRYDVSLTLDGREDTAWNSDGDNAARVGSRLTYRFAEPVRLARITVVNGWVRVSPTAGDLFVANHRVAELTVETEQGRTTWQLADTRDPQSLTQDLGVTSQVTLVVERTHDAGTRFPDVALAEVGFDALPADAAPTG